MPPRSRSRDALDDRTSRRVEEPRWQHERFERSISSSGVTATAATASGVSGERYQQAAARRMEQWLAERSGAPSSRRGSGGNGGDRSAPEPIPAAAAAAAAGECPRPQARGFLRRAPRNAGLYSERTPVRIPSPDYSGSGSTVVRLNISNRILDMPSAMY